MSILLYSLGVSIAAATSVELEVWAYRFLRGSKLLTGLGGMVESDSIADAAPC